MSQVPIAFAAKVLNTTISKASRKFGGKGHIELEEFIEWVEKHSGHPDYVQRVAMIEKMEKKLATQLPEKPQQ